VLDSINDELEHELEHQIEMPEILQGEPHEFASGMAGKAHIQTKIMKAIHDLDIDRFKQKIRKLPADAQERLAFTHNGMFTRQWITECDGLNGAELREIYAIHMGLPSPACAGSIGQEVMRTGKRLDKYGRVLHAEKAVPGGDFTKRHDLVKWAIDQICRKYGNAAETEVYNMFRSLINHHGELGVREMQGMVPDFRLLMATLENGMPGRRRLAELKAIGNVASHYPRINGRRASTPFYGVNKRAEKLDNEYTKKAQKLDQAYNGASVGEIGPVEAYLRSYQADGQLLLRLVFGAFGDASPDFDVLVQGVATTGAKKHWRRMQCKSPTEAFGIIVWRIRKALGSRWWSGRPGWW